MSITKLQALDALARVEAKRFPNLSLPRFFLRNKGFERSCYRLLYRSWDDSIGALREDFFATAMIMANMPFHYLKSTTGRKTPDFWLTTESGDWVVEIGGPGKGRTQFKGVRVERKMVLVHEADSRRNAKPLFMAGYLA